MINFWGVGQNSGIRNMEWAVAALLSFLQTSLHYSIQQKIKQSTSFYVSYFDLKHYILSMFLGWPKVNLAVNLTYP